MTIMRREIYLKQRAREMGISVLYIDEAVSSTALAHEDGWLDVIVDSETGEPAKVDVNEAGEVFQVPKKEDE